MSVPRGSRAVSPVLARRRLTGRQYPCLCEPCPRPQPTSRASATSVPASEPRVTGRRPSHSVPGTHRRPGAAPRLQALAAFPTSRARAPDERPPPRRRVRTGPIPTQARASATGGFEHRPTRTLRNTLIFNMTV